MNDPVFTTDLSDAELIARFPAIPWARAMPVNVPGVGHGLGCRICIARYGLRGADVINLAQNEDEWTSHMREFHADILKDGHG